MQVGQGNVVLLIGEPEMMEAEIKDWLEPFAAD
jgi:hypothetical protein